MSSELNVSEKLVAVYYAAKISKSQKVSMRFISGGRVAYAHACFNDLGLDARSQWVSKGKKISVPLS